MAVAKVRKYTLCSSQKEGGAIAEASASGHGLPSWSEEPQELLAV